MADPKPTGTRPNDSNATPNAPDSNAPSANLTGSKPAETTMPVKKSVTLLLNVQEKDVPVVITDLANFRLELTERVDFGSVTTFTKWLNDNYGSGVPGPNKGSEIKLPPISDVPPQLRTLYLVFTNAHVWLDALMIDRKTKAFKFGVSIDFTQTPIDEKQLTALEKDVETKVSKEIEDKVKAKDPQANAEKVKQELEKAKTDDKALSTTKDAEEAKGAITKPASGGWEILPGIKIKGIGVMFERPPAAETAKADTPAATTRTEDNKAVTT